MNNNKIIEITRTFDASREQVWHVWTNPEFIRRWWGPEGFTCPDAKEDFRVGGKYLRSMRDPDGKVTWATGTYREIVNGQKIVATDSFSDPDGNVISAKEAGMPGDADWPMELLITTHFEEVSPTQTRLHLRHEGVPTEMFEDCVQGWNSILDKFALLVSERAQAA